MQREKIEDEFGSGLATTFAFCLFIVVLAHFYLE